MFNYNKLPIIFIQHMVILPENNMKVSNGIHIKQKRPTPERESDSRISQNRALHIALANRIFDLIDYLSGSKVRFNKVILRAEFKSALHVFFLPEIAQNNNRDRTCLCWQTR